MGVPREGEGVVDTTYTKRDDGDAPRDALPDTMAGMRYSGPGRDERSQSTSVASVTGTSKGGTCVARDVAGVADGAGKLETPSSGCSCASPATSG